MGIIVYNVNIESHEGDANNYIIMRPSILSNPYTHLELEKTRALYKCKNRDEAIDKYSYYFDVMYKGNSKFRSAVDEIYAKYRTGENVYLGCCCKPLPCHGDIIAKKLQQRLIKEKIQELKNAEKR